MQMFNQNPDPEAVAKAKEALKVCRVLLSDAEPTTALVCGTVL